MIWNISGDVETGSIGSKKVLCERPAMSRIMFNTHAPDWLQCMDQCPKYNGAKAPSFSNKQEMVDLATWAINTTIDPIAKGRRQ